MEKAKTLQNEIGLRIRYIRENLLNLSQKELAERCSLDATYISRVEKGKQNITIDTLEQICNALNITAKDFFVVEIPDNQ